LARGRAPQPSNRRRACARPSAAAAAGRPIEAADAAKYRSRNAVVEHGFGRPILIAGHFEVPGVDPKAAFVA
jgi:hypothetical protein